MSRAPEPGRPAAPDREHGSAPGAPEGASGASETLPRPAPWSRKRQNVAIVLWPSFLVAAVATMFFFAVFDPPVIGEGTPLHDLLQNREAGYAFGFFVFWVLASASSTLTLYLARTQRAEPGPHVEPWMRDIP
jgi:hypothetical protein